MGGGMDSVWPPSLTEFHFLAVSRLRCQKITIHLSVSPSPPCRLQTRRVLNIDGPHREAQAVGASVTPGDVEHRHDTWDVFEGALCFYKQQNYFFRTFFIIMLISISRCQFQMCLWSPCLFLLSFVAMKERVQRRRFCCIWAPGCSDLSLISREIQMARSFEWLTNGFSFAR